MLTRLSGILLLSIAFALPAALPAQDHDHDHDRDQQQRYYDSSHKDYHQWTDNEDRAYHQYVNEKHLHDRPFDKISKKQQTQYWSWRHEHPDSH